MTRDGEVDAGGAGVVPLPRHGDGAAVGHVHVAPIGELVVRALHQGLAPQGHFHSGRELGPRVGGVACNGHVGAADAGAVDGEGFADAAGVVTDARHGDGAAVSHVHVVPEGELVVRALHQGLAPQGHHHSGRELGPRVGGVARDGHVGAADVSFMDVEAFGGAPGVIPLSPHVYHIAVRIDPVAVGGVFHAIIGRPERFAVQRHRGDGGLLVGAVIRG